MGVEDIFEEIAAGKFYSHEEFIREFSRLYESLEAYEGEHPARRVEEIKSSLGRRYWEASAWVELSHRREVRKIVPDRIQHMDPKNLKRFQEACVAYNLAIPKIQKGYIPPECERILSEVHREARESGDPAFENVAAQLYSDLSRRRMLLREDDGA